MFYLTSRDAKTVRRTSWRLIVLMAQAVVFCISDDIELDLCSIGCHESRHEVLRIRHLFMDDITALKVLKNALCFIMGYFVVMETYVMLPLLPRPP